MYIGIFIMFDENTATNKTSYKIQTALFSSLFHKLYL